MKHCHSYAVRVLCSLAGMLLAASAFAADADVTGLVPTIWWDFETQPDAVGLKTTNKGSAFISLSNEGTATYKAGANGGYALDTSKFTPYSGSGTFSTAGQPFTISLVMTLGTNPNGITLNVRSNAGDLIIRRGDAAGSLVVGFGPQEKESTKFLNTNLPGDSEYHLVSVVGRSGGTELYIDGTLAALSTEFTPWSESGVLNQMQFGSHIGGLKSGDVSHGGCIDDLRIHAVALTPAQMKAIAAEYKIIMPLDMFQVMGTPSNWGTVVPGYGVTNGLSQGDSFACSAFGSETAVTKIIPIGYSLYFANADGSYSLGTESAATTFTYTHGATSGRLVWNWAHSNFVSVVTSEGGAVSAGDWVGYGDSFTVTATPYSGYKFSRWTGDTAGIDVRSASVVLSPVTEPRALSAVFINENIDESVQWVSPDGNDEKDGYDEASPKKTIAAAVTTLNPVAANKTCIVHVAPGLYPISSPIVVTNAIHILGADPDPLRTVVSNSINTGWYDQDQRVFSINNASAFVANLTMQNGGVWNIRTGGNFYIGSAGGVVSNCVSEAGASGLNSYAAGAALDGGLVTHTVFRKNTSGSGMGSWQGQHGGVLDLNGSSRAENCLFVNNDQTASVYLIQVAGSSVMRNCTIVDSALSRTNDSCKVFSSLRINSVNAIVQNVVIAGVTNMIDGAACPPTGTVNNFLNSAYDGDITGLPAGTITGTAATFFKKYEEGDYRPKTGGVLVNKGQSYEPMAARDLGGNKRLIGSKIDIGCYEAPAAEFRIRLR